MQRLCVFSIVLLQVCASFAADPSNMKIPAVKKIGAKEVQPQRSVFEGRRWNNPLVLKTADEAAKHFDKTNLAKLNKQVDYDRQYVLLFAWGGSGGDRLTYEADGESTCV